MVPFSTFFFGKLWKTFWFHFFFQCMVGPVLLGYHNWPIISITLHFVTNDVEPFTLNSAYERNLFRWAVEQAQILNELIYHCWYWANIVRAEPEPSDWFQIDQILHWRQWAKSYNANCISFTHVTENDFYITGFLFGVEIWCSSKLFSVSCVNI